MVVGLTAAACIAWMAWAWSPAKEQEPAQERGHDHDPGEMSPPPVSAPVHPVAPKPGLVAPGTPAPEATHAQAEPVDGSPVQPERIPTPHPMSLDQTKPPERQGPLSELQHQYASESRAAESSVAEANLRSLLNTPNVPAELVQAITCRRTICRIDTLWTPHRRLGFVVLLESLKQLYKQQVAVQPADGPAQDGTYATSLFLRLNP